MADESVPSSSTPAEATPSAPATPPDTGAIAQPATSATTQTPATGAPPAGQEGWVPSWRIREVREQAQRQAQQDYAQREGQVRAEAERYRQQVLALTGVQPPPNPEIAAVKSQFGQLYPGLAKMEDKVAQLEALLERAGDLESQNSHYWNNYGKTTMDRVFTKASESLGAPLTDEGKRVLHSAFTGFVSSSPEMTDRYANDPTIVDDFMKAFASNFIDPARRAATVTATGRVATGLPQDTPSGAPRSSPAPKFEGMDDRVSAAWAQYQAGKGGHT